MTNNSLNSYGVPLHACNGYKQDEHYWAYIGEKNKREKQYQKEWSNLFKGMTASVLYKPA